MTTRGLLRACGWTGLAVSLPFVLIHLLANPDDAPITPLQHAAAAVANFFGPWGVVLVRAVDFPNAGLRDFSWAWALGLTLVGGLLLLAALRAQRPPLQYLVLGGWAVFALVWFGVGLAQIAAGLL